ncbi:phosphomethylpyrimidine kinase [Streptococcus pneumoniae]|nr:phosphomethylpyrimidine kinase [Streptococcus pneumoniae]VMP73638.1 phosphomethylpyrimidine kinase [Streptococcus pneumoniae]
MKNNRILALSGNDIFSGGGLSADLATYTLNGLHGFVAVTCLTALTEKGFEVFPTDDTIFQHELDSLRDVEFGGIKIGLLPTVSVITPNLPEAELLSGQEIKTLEDMKTAAQKLHDLGAPAVIIKGGNRLSQDKAVDVFYDGQTFTILENPVIQGQNAGAGCTFASSIASHLVKGDKLLPAVESSKAFVYRAIAQADQYGVRQYEANKNN